MKTKIDTMITGAEISDCKKYRYALWRIWDNTTPMVMFIMHNPSTADDINNDPTIRKCMKFAKEWKFGGIIVCNLYAYRSTAANELLKVEDPVGPENSSYLIKMANKSDLIIAAWGLGVPFENDFIPDELKDRLHYLKLNKGDVPAHPLYLNPNLKPKERKWTH